MKQVSDTLSVGAQLKRAREQLRLSLKDATNATKIQSWVLEALERDQLHPMMSPVYVKGFLTTYAKFLRLDPAPLIEQLIPPPPPVSPVSSGGGSAQGVSWTSAWEPVWPLLRRMGSIAVGAAAIGLLLVARPWQWVPTHVAHKAASLSVGHNQPPPSLDAVMPLDPARPLELVIVAHRPTWVSVKADGALIAQHQLSAGIQETWKARRRFEVVVGTPTKVDILLNGRSISPAAVAHHGRLLITHRGVKPLQDSAR